MTKLNKHSRLIFFIALFAITLTTSSCLKPLIPGKIDGIKLHTASLKGIKFELRLPIENPNIFKFSLRHIDLDVSLNGIPLGKIGTTQKVKIKRRSNDVHSFVIEIQVRDLLGSAMKVVQELSKRSTKLKVSGEIKVGAFLFTKTIKINQDSRVHVLRK